MDGSGHETTTRGLWSVLEKDMVNLEVSWSVGFVAQGYRLGFLLHLKVIVILFFHCRCWLLDLDRREVLPCVCSTVTSIANLYLVGTGRGGSLDLDSFISWGNEGNRKKWKAMR